MLRDASHYDGETREAAEKKAEELKQIGCFEVEIIEEAETETKAA